jgi:hypothetical protein
MALLRELVVGIGFDFDPAGIASAERAVIGFSRAVGKAFDALIVEPILAADALNDLAKQTGISAQAFQELKFAADQSGLGAEGLTTGVRQLSKQIFEAAGGSKEARKSFASLGLDFSKLAKIPVDQALTEVLDRLGKIKNPAQRAGASMELLGRSGTEMLQFAGQGRKGIEALRAEFQALGGGSTDDFVKRSDELVDSFHKIQVAGASLIQRVASRILPVLEQVVSGVLAWWKANQKLVTAGLDRFLDAVISTLPAISRGIKELIAFFTPFVAIALRAFDGLVQLFNLMGPGLSAVAVGMVGLLKNLGSGATLTVLWRAAQALLFQDLLTWVAGGESAIGRLIDSFNMLIDKLLNTKLGKGAFGEFVENFRVLLTGMFDTVRAGFKALLFGDFKEIEELFTNAVKGWRDALSGSRQRDHRTPGQTLVEDFQNSSVNRFLDASLPQFLGGKPSINNATVAPNNTLNVTVNAPGGDGKSIATSVKAAISDFFETQNRELVGATTPSGQ